MSNQLTLFLKKAWYYKVNILVPSFTFLCIYADWSRTQWYKEQLKLEAEKVKG